MEKRKREGDGNKWNDSSHQRNGEDNESRNYEDEEDDDNETEDHELIYNEHDFRRARRWFGFGVHDGNEDDSESDSNSDFDNDSDDWTEYDSDESEGSSTVDYRSEIDDEPANNPIVESEPPESRTNRSLDVGEDDYMNEELECSVPESDSDDGIGTNKSNKSRAKKRQKMNNSTAVASSVETKVELSTDMLGVIADSGDKSCVQLLKSDNNALAKQFSFGDRGPCNLVFSPDCSKVAQYGDGVRIWNVGTGKRLTKINCRGRTVCVQFSHKGDRVLCRSESGSMRVWDLESRLKVAYLFCYDVMMPQALFSTDDKLIICSSEVLIDGHKRSRLKIWNVETGEMVKAMGPTRSRIHSMATPADFSQLVVGCKNGRLIFHNISDLSAATPNAIRIVDTWDDRDKEIHKSLCFTSDNTILVSGGWTSITVWDVLARSISRRIEIQGHYLVLNVSISQTNDRIAAKMRNGCCLFDLETGKWIPTSTRDMSLWLCAVYSRPFNVLL